MKYDIFISYRREGGEYTARILHDKLSEMGYKVFFDVESLRSGQFNTKLFDVIDECPDFISILSPNCLDRCESEDDWVRLEIAHALQGKKNVVPVLLRGFQFPDQLPEDIDVLRYQSGIEASTEFFDAFAVKLTEFLKSKPRVYNRITQNRLLRKMLPVILAFFIVAGVIFAGAKLYERSTSSFPVTKTEKATVSDVISFVTTNLAQANVAFLEYQKAIDSCRDSLDYPSEDKASQLPDDLQYRKSKISEAQNHLVSPEDSLNEKLYKTSQLSKSDIAAVKDTISNYMDEMLSNIDYLNFLTSDNTLSTSTKSKLLECYQKLLTSKINYLFYGINYIFTDVNEAALEEFKTETLPDLTYIFNGQIWREDKQELKTLEDAEYAKMQNTMMDISSIIGDLNIDTDRMEAALNPSASIQPTKPVTQAPTQTTPTIQADVNSTGDNNDSQAQKDEAKQQAELEAKQAEVKKKEVKLEQEKKELEQKKDELSDLKQEAKDKFKPLESDDLNTLWGKACRFNTLKMYDMCIECLEMFQKKVDLEEAKTFVPILIKFYQQVDKTGIDYGCLVGAYAPDQPKNEFFKIGDILIEINGKKIKSSMDYKATADERKSGYKVKVLRYNGKSFDTIEGNIKAEDPIVYYYDICETDTEQN